ncbi:phage recombination protein Bet, partial [Streptomyces sp. SID8111]|uniref:phage recombination protein Bet n=1 Tax=Streptomyces sp. SID8111 TaxID=2706100 RepID=UPI0013C1E7FF|nr:phage recombination protein Bet [Streptomyces sp. SID8111]
MTVTALPARTTHEGAPAHHGGALAVRPDQTMWTPEQAAVLRQSGIKDNVAAAELSSFLHLCQRTGLDPFSRQIYLIGRWSKKDGRDVYTPQTGIDGYRVIAQRVTAQTGGTYGYEDTVWCDQSGRWRDVWLAPEPPAAAKVTVIRNGQRFSAVAAFREYVQTFPDGNPKGLWAKMPAGQIAKCAEALALRKAFPHDLAGVYTAEEMAQAENAEQEQAAPEQPRRAQRAEPGPWEQQAPPTQQAPRRDFLAEAQAAADADEVRALWSIAKRAGA